MGCGASIAAPPKPLFKSEFDVWWQKHKELLYSRIVEKDYIEAADDAAMASSLVTFIGQSLSAVRWEAMDSERAQAVTTYADYKEVYAAKLGTREDVSSDNLYRIKLRADQAIQDGIAAAANNPPLQNLLKKIYHNKEALKWSQGSFGPMVYTANFLRTYANAMVSDSLWQQSDKTYANSYFTGPRPLECGIFYIDPGVEYPLHYHKELESYFILSGKTQFLWLVDNQLVTMDREQGEWHFNYPNTPHAITTPFGQPHLSLWFREGGPGQKANNKFGPKWIGNADGLRMIDEYDEDGIPDHEDVAIDDNKMIGSYGFAAGSVFKKDTDRFLRALSPAQFDYLRDDPNAMSEIDNLLTPGKVNALDTRVAALKRKEACNVYRGLPASE
eukprot:CAMPEP_0117472652 /NCGR_PEP_ID=MMETSP0784-20121206/8361_1 /TAXON_ID=39447 /ORGANISM="" /LENGTH=386 /DNA_ID=CAMNT_0005266817 /DNA_START=99 /DNA_END=1259 /DNA_ORIENTATION=+